MAETSSVLANQLFAELGQFRTTYETLKENHEILKRDYASLKERYKIVEDLNEVLKLRFTNPGVELEKERKEKEEIKKELEEMKVKHQELLVAKEKSGEDLKKIEDKYKALSEKFDEVETDCRSVKSLFDAEVIMDQHRNDEVKEVDCHVMVNTVKDAEDGVDGGNEVAIDKEVIVLNDDHNKKNDVTDADNGGDQEGNKEDLNDDVIVADALQNDRGNNEDLDDVVVATDGFQNVNNTVTDTIVISDGSDDEKTHPSIFPQKAVVPKQEEGCSSVAASSPKAQNPLFSSSSSSSSDSDSSSSEEVVLIIPRSLKRTRDDYNQS